MVLGKSNLIIGLFGTLIATFTAALTGTFIGSRMANKQTQKALIETEKNRVNINAQLELYKYLIKLLINLYNKITKVENELSKFYRLLII